MRPDEFEFARDVATSVPTVVDEHADGTVLGKNARQDIEALTSFELPSRT